MPIMSIPTDTTFSRQMRKAIAALQRGEPGLAERYLAQVVEARPDFADGWHFRAIAAHQLGNSEAASDWLEVADRLAPNRPDFILNRARFFLERKEFTKACEAASVSMAHQGHAEEAVMILANAQLASGQLDDALISLRAFIRSHPTATKATLLLVTMLRENGRDEDIESVYLDVLNAQPDNHEVRFWYTAFLHDEGRYEEADQISTDLAAHPEVAALALTHLALSSLQRGDYDQAESYSASALRRDASLGTAWLAWIETGAPERDLPVPFPSMGDSSIAFARARLLDRRRDYQNAWTQYTIAHEAARRETGRYDREGQSTYVDNILSHLDEAFVERALRHATQQPGPIFVCGISRSGTTLLEQLLASHPTLEVHAGGEMRALHQLLRRHIGARSLTESGSGLALMGPSDLAELLREWHKAIVSAKGNATYVTDKMPSNAFLLGLIHSAYPQAPIVLLERDPLAIACSCFVTPFSEGHYFTHDFSDMAHFFAQYRRIVNHWDQVLPRGSILKLGFEDLVRDPQGTLQPLLERLQLTWDDQMLDFHRRREPVATASLLQVRRPLDTGAIDGWQRFREQLEPWRKTLQDAYYNGNLDLET